MAVEKKAAGLQAPQNPLAVPEKGDSARELDDGERRALQYVIADSLNSLKRNLCEVVENWNNRFDHLLRKFLAFFHIMLCKIGHKLDCVETCVCSGYQIAGVHESGEEENQQGPAEPGRQTNSTAQHRSGTCPLT